MSLTTDHYVARLHERAEALIERLHARQTADVELYGIVEDILGTLDEFTAAQTDIEVHENE